MITLHTNKKLVIPVLIVVIATIFLASFREFFFTKKEEVIYLNDIDQKIISNEEVQKILSKSYFEGTNNDQFSSANLVIKDVDPYKLYWTIQIMNQLNYRVEDLNSIKKMYFHMIENKIDYNSLNDLRIISGIMKSLKINDAQMNKKIYQSVLFKYNKKESMFFYNDEKEPFKRKLVATLVAVETLNNIQYSSDVLGLVKEKVVSLLNNKDMFIESENFQNDFLNNGSTIIQILEQLGYSGDDIINSSNHNVIEWLNYWNKKANSIVNYDWFSLSILDTLSDINSSFSRKTEINGELLINMGKSNNLLQEKVFSEKGFVLEPQYIYLVTKMIDEQNASFLSYIDKVKWFIDTTIQNGFVKSIDPKENIYDIFYGICLAKISGFDFDREKIAKTMDDFFIKLVDEDSYINDSKKLRSILYLTKSYNALNLGLKKKEFIANSVGEYLKKTIASINENNNNARQISDIRMSLDILNEINFEVNKDEKQKIVNLLDSIQKNKNKEYEYLFYSIGVTDLYFIVAQLNEIENFSQLISDIEVALNNLRDGNGFKSKKIGGIPDINSTSIAIEVLTNLNKLDENAKNEIMQYLTELRDDRNIVFISKVNEYTDLRVISSACEIIYDLYEI